MIPESDKIGMKEFYENLKVFDPIFMDFYQSFVLCLNREDSRLLNIDQPKQLIKTEYDTFCDAFYAGEEVVILAHHDENYNYYIDGVYRPSNHYIDHQPHYDGHKHLIQDKGDLIAFTMQEKFEVKRFGLVSTTNGGSFLFVENPLHIDIRKGMSRLIEVFQKSE